jgi:Domain of unknown function (DUF4832)/Domain of unknown function (DUF4874)
VNGARLLIAAGLVACAPGSGDAADEPGRAQFVSQVSTPVGTQRRTYTPSLENFPNPERGFAFENDVAWPAQTPWPFCTDPRNDFSKYDYVAWNDPLKPEFLRRERAQGRSVVASRYHIADFRSRPLTPEYLAFLQRDFDTARNAGIKLSLRFAYNYPNGGPDAPLKVILGHIGQLGPVFKKNADVIAYLEAGFVGCWGEWHHSSNGLSGEGTPQDGYLTAAEKTILGALLAAVPRQRMIALRYPRQKFEYFGSPDFVPIAPLSAAQAFTGDDRARIGHQEDCFVCSESHGGSYRNPRGDLNEIPRFLAQENRFVVQEGEPGSPETISPDVPGNPDSKLASCPVVLEELSSKFWSVLGLFDLGSKTSVIDRWKREGCHDEIARRLGYRFQLLSAELPRLARPGQKLSAQFVMTNDGFANPYNPRRLELVLRAKSGGALSRISVYDDARLKLPAPGETRTIRLGVRLPSTLKSGRYELLLALPDPAPSLKNRPEYAVRLANEGVWEEKTGLNALGHTLEVLP